MFICIRTFRSWLRGQVTLEIWKYFHASLGILIEELKSNKRNFDNLLEKFDFKANINKKRKFYR